MPTIRLLDCSPLDGLEVEVTSLPPATEHFGRRFERLGIQQERVDDAGRVIWGNAVVYVWENIMRWMGR